MVQLYSLIVSWTNAVWFDGRWDKIGSESVDGTLHRVICKEIPAAHKGLF
jgi:hypothetical protein